MGKSVTPPITTTETGGGDVISYGLNRGVSKTPAVTAEKANTNITLTYQPS